MDNPIDSRKAIEMLRDAPPWLQTSNLIIGCKVDETGDFERIARILAAHHVPPEEIVPCIMEMLLAITDDYASKT